MSLRVVAADVHLTELRTRMPFRYGIATMTRSPHAFVRLHVDFGGATSVGIAADHLPPKWFTKDPARPVDEEVDEMLRVIAHAVRGAEGLHADSPFDAWRQLYAAQDGWGRAQGLPPLLTHFGTSLVERALIEAVCRQAGWPFWELLRRNTFGIRLGEVHPGLARRKSPATILGLRPGRTDRPLPAIIARHTVGLADPLTDDDVPPAERLDDGLPQSLEACVRTYGLRHVKIKVNGDLGRDRERVRRIAAVLATNGPPDFAFSLDGNEQFRSADEFRGYWLALTADAGLRSFWGHLLFVEQPFHRSIALDAAAVGGLREWEGCPPLIIDESDGELTSLREALALGYAGTSHKNCKGVFKSIANACLLAHLRRDAPSRRLILSGEDLANVGPVALLQDLAVCAALGIESVERNGHHYFAGLSMFPAAVQEQILAAHGDLYHRTAAGWPSLTIEGGLIRLRSVNRAPFGVGPRVDVEQFTPLDAWRAAPDGDD